jgi:hypothetical protein
MDKTTRTTTKEEPTVKTKTIKLLATFSRSTVSLCCYSLFFSLRLLLFCAPPLMGAVFPLAIAHRFIALGFLSSSCPRLATTKSEALSQPTRGSLQLEPGSSSRLFVRMPAASPDFDVVGFVRGDG